MRRAALLGLAGLFTVAAVAGFVGSNGWVADVDAVELQGGPAIEAAQPAAPAQSPQGPQPEGDDDEPVARKLDEEDSDVESFDDGTSGGNNTGDGDNTRGDDGTSGGNNTGDGENSNTGGRTTG